MRSLSLSLTVLVFVWSILIASVNADYYIAASNSSLQYLPATGAKQWGPPTKWDAHFNMSNCVNSTCTYNECKTSDNCRLTIPFTGSGISIYTLLLPAASVNLSITLDSSPPTIESFALPSTGSTPLLNISMHSIKGLPTGPHTLSVELRSVGGVASAVGFDYAIVDETFVAETAGGAAHSPESSHTPAPAPDPTPPKSRTNVGAIAGGVVGAVVFLIAGGLALFWYLKKKRNTNTATAFHKEAMAPRSSDAMSAKDNDSPVSMPNMSMARKDLTADLSDPSAYTNAQPSITTLVTPESSLTFTSASYSPTSGTHAHPPPVPATQRRVAGGPNTRIGPRPSTGASVNSIGGARSIRSAASPSPAPAPSPPNTTGIAGIARAQSPPANPVPIPTHAKRGSAGRRGSAGSSPQSPLPQALRATLVDFTPAQMEFVEGLHRMDVPLAEISRIVEVIREESANGGDGGGVPANIILASGAPPVYQP